MGLLDKRRREWLQADESVGAMVFVTTLRRDRHSVHFVAGDFGGKEQVTTAENPKPFFPQQMSRPCMIPRAKVYLAVEKGDVRFGEERHINGRLIVDYGAHIRSDVSQADASKERAVVPLAPRV